MDYTEERHAFPGYNSRKVKTFRGLFCIEAGFAIVKSAESFYFSWTILRKGMPFRRIICGKSKFSAYHTAEKRAFPWNNLCKIKVSANYLAESFSIKREVKISLFKGISLLLQIILDKKSTMGDQYYPSFGRKINKHDVCTVTENNVMTLRR